MLPYVRADFVETKYHTHHKTMELATFIILSYFKFILVVHYEGYSPLRNMCCV